MPGGGEELAAALDRTLQQLARVRPELDALVRGLGGVDRAGLVPALERLAVGLPVEVDLELADVTVSPEVASALWFVCSESLANAVKHAEARTIRVALAPANGIVRLSVEDDGRGGANAGGSGLVGLADRVAALGGRLAVVSPPGGGTQVVAELPLPERPRDRISTVVSLRGGQIAADTGSRWWSQTGHSGPIGVQSTSFQVPRNAFVHPRSVRGSRATISRSRPSRFQENAMYSVHGVAGFQRSLARR